MRPRPVRLDDLGHEPSVLEPRAARSSRAGRAARPRADVRRQRPHAPPGVERDRRGRARGRPGVIFSAYVAPSPGCGSNAASGSTASSSRAASSRRPLVDAARVELADRERLLRRDRARRRARRPSRWIVTPVSLVAGEDRALDRRRAAPARQERRVDVQPERALEQARRDVEAVRADDDARRRHRGARASRAGAPGCRAGRPPPSRAAARACGRGPAARPGA